MKNKPCGKCKLRKKPKNPRKNSKYCNCGAPTKYDPKYCDEVIEYFDREPLVVLKNKKGEAVLNKFGNAVMVPAEFPTVEGFAEKLKVVVKTLHNWQEEHKEFLHAYTRAKRIQKKILIVNGLNRTYDNKFSIFVGTNCTDMVDEKKVDAGESLVDIMKKYIEK